MKYKIVEHYIIGDIPFSYHHGLVFCSKKAAQKTLDRWWDEDKCSAKLNGLELPYLFEIVEA